jgi:hypothetical protein
MTPDAPPPSPEQAAPARSRDLRLGRWLAMLISVSLTGLSVWTLISGHYEGRNTRSSAAPVALDGPAALAMGLAQIALGSLPLALLARNGRQAGFWATGCGVAALVAFMVSLRLSA